MPPGCPPLKLTSSMLYYAIISSLESFFSTVMSGKPMCSWAQWRRQDLVHARRGTKVRENNLDPKGDTQKYCEIHAINKTKL